MDLVLVRHGIAEPRSARGRDADARRALTPEGRRRMVRAARGLSILVPEVEVVVPSPLVRALETARIVAEAYGLEPADPVPALEGVRPPEESLEPLRALSRRAATLALVGHEPQLSALAALLVAGADRPLFTLRKGGACLIRLGDAVRPGRGELRWLATARLLRALGARDRA